LLEPPAYTGDEQKILIDFVLALQKRHVRDFLKRAGLRSSGTKPDLREKIQEALQNGDLTYEQVVDFLDSVASWGKQHVILYKGPRGDLRSWKDADQIQRHLKQHRVGKFLNARLPLILPDELTLSSITHSDGTLRVVAVQKQEYTERTPEHDARKEVDDGALITLKAYKNHVLRALVVFEWNLTTNTATW